MSNHKIRIKDKVVIVEQFSMQDISITNNIEDIVLKGVFGKGGELAGEEPSEYKIYQHYMPDLDPLVEWERVTFDSSGNPSWYNCKSPE